MGVSLPEHCGVLRIYHPVPKAQLERVPEPRPARVWLVAEKARVLTEQANGRVKVAVSTPASQTI